MSLAVAIVGHEAKAFDQSWFKPGHPLGVELDLLEIVGGDVELYLMSGEIWKVAVAALMASGADEVVVSTSELAGALGELEAAPATAAIDGALQMVAVLPLVLSRDRTRSASVAPARRFPA